MAAAPPPLTDVPPMPRSLPVALLAAVLPLAPALLVGCGEDPDYSHWEDTQAESSQEGAVAVENAGTAADAAEFNKFFPEQSGGFDIIYRQEKGGTAICDLEKDETLLCTFSITDLATIPSAKEKFATPDMEIDGYPAVKQGSKTTALLVNDRYQVKAASKDEGFSAVDREAWLNKFDLAGLAALDALK